MISSIISRFKNIDNITIVCNFYIFSCTSFSMGASYYFLKNNINKDISENNLIYYRSISI